MRGFLPVLKGQVSATSPKDETFKLSNEEMDEPARRIQAVFTDKPHQLLYVHVGETFRVPLR